MEATEQVLTFIKNNPNTNKPAISEATGIKGLQLFNVLKKLQSEEQITSQGEGQDITYSISAVGDVTETGDEEVSGNILTIEPLEPSLEIIADMQDETLTEDKIILDEKKNDDNILEEKDNEKKDDEKNEDKKEDVAKSTTTRNNDKYRLNDDTEEFGKGGLVRVVIKLYVEQNPTVTYKQLKEIFPDTLMKRFGVFEEIAKAKEISGKRDRYFFKPEQIIKLGDKKQVAICSQWTATLIIPFIETATKLGFKIK